MKKNSVNTIKYFLVCFIVLFVSISYAQDDRIKNIEQNFVEISKTVPGLLEKVDFSVSGASIQEFIRGIAEANNLNVNIDSKLNFKIYNNFKNETVLNILLFIIKEYNLDVRFVGSIISFFPYTSPQEEKPITKPKPILISYNKDRKRISFDLHDDTLSNVFKIFTQLTGINVGVEPGLGTKKLNGYIQDLPIEDALNQITFSNEFKTKKLSDSIFYIFTKDAGLQETDNVRGSTYKVNKTSGESNSFNVLIKDTLGKKLISMEVNNVPVLDLIKSVADKMGISYFLFSDIKGNTTNFIKDVDFNSFLRLLFLGTDYTYKFENSLYLLGDRKLEGLRSFRVIQFQYRSFEDIQELIPNELKKGVEIKEFNELNSILVSGALPQINEIENFIKSLDKIVPLISVEVILLDIRKGKSIKTGINAGISDSVKTGGSVFPGLDFNLSSKSINSFLTLIEKKGSINIGRVTPSFYVGLSALEQNSNAEVRSMPKLATLNGHEANLSIGSTRYYSTTTQNVLGSLNPQTVVTQQFTPVQANLTINIKPVVSGDDQVTLNIDVNISDFIGEPPQNSPPPSSNSQFKSIIRVRNEEMVVLGGIERMENSDSGSGFPILSRVPVLKWFFSSRSKSNNKIVSIVFIKPTISY